MFGFGNYLLKVALIDKFFNFIIFTGEHILIKFACNNYVRNIGIVRSVETF